MAPKNEHGSIANTFAKSPILVGHVSNTSSASPSKSGVAAVAPRATAAAHSRAGPYIKPSYIVLPKSRNSTAEGARNNAHEMPMEKVSTCVYCEGFFLKANSASARAAVRSTAGSAVPGLFCRNPTNSTGPTSTLSSQYYLPYADSTCPWCHRFLVKVLPKPKGEIAAETHSTANVDISGVPPTLYNPSDDSSIPDNPGSNLHPDPYLTDNVTRQVSDRQPVNLMAPITQPSWKPSTDDLEHPLFKSMKQLLDRTIVAYDEKVAKLTSRIDVLEKQSTPLNDIIVPSSKRNAFTTHMRLSVLETMVLDLQGQYHRVQDKMKQSSQFLSEIEASAKASHAETMAMLASLQNDAPESATHT